MAITTLFYVVIAKFNKRLAVRNGWWFFDRRTAVKWSDKIYMREKAVDRKTVTVVGA